MSHAIGKHYYHSVFRFNALDSEHIATDMLAIVIPLFAEHLHKKVPAFYRYGLSSNRIYCLGFHLVLLIILAFAANNLIRIDDRIQHFFSL